MSPRLLGVLVLLLLPALAWGQALSRREVALLNPLEYGTTCTTATLSAAIGAAVTTGRVLMLTPVDRDGTACTWTITSNVTVPSHITLHVPHGTSVSISTGVTLTLARYPREDNRAWKTGAGKLVITAPDPAGRHNVQDFGAKGDGTTVDVAAIQAAFAAASGVGGTRVIYFPSGIYFLGVPPGLVDNESLLDLSPYGDNLTIQTEKSVELLTNTSATTPLNVIPNMVLLRNNNHLRVGPIRLRDLGYDATVVFRGTAGFALAGEVGDNWGDVVFESLYGFQVNSPIEIRGGGGAAYRVRGVHIKELYSIDCFYGFSAQNQGDGVVIDYMEAYGNYRPYFVYGVTGHRVHMLYNRRNRVTSGMVVINRLPGGGNTKDIHVNYVGREMEIQGGTPHVSIAHLDLNGGEISNIKLHINIADASNTIQGFPIRFHNYTGAGGTETTAPSPNVVKDITLSGTANPGDGAAWIEASYATKGRLSWRPGHNLVLVQGFYDKFALSQQQRDSTGVVWGASGTPPSLGNGTLTYDLDIVDGVIHLSLHLVFGSTTTGGTGDWFFSGFGNPVLSGMATVRSLGTCFMTNAGVKYYTGVSHIFDNSTTVSCYVNDNVLALGPTVPFTWGVGDSLHITITYPLS